MSFAFCYNPEQEPPFVIYIAHEDKTRDKHWRPAAMIGFTAGLRTSGFLSALGPEEFQSLLLLLSFLSPDGRLNASTLQLAQALGLSAYKTRLRFERLSEVRWLDQPIVRATNWGNGMDGFALSPGFIPTVEEPQGEVASPPIQAVPREVLVERSRRTYARTREEVEREIAEMMNWRKASQSASSQPVVSESPAQNPESALSAEQAELRGKLIAVGLLPEQADHLMKRFDAVRIHRQLAWLPLRGAKNQAGYLLAAVKDDYAAPRAINPLLSKPRDER